MDGLIIKKKWLDEIFRGKWMEVRGSNCPSHIGKPIALIESGTGLIKGVTVISHTFQLRGERHFKSLHHCHFIKKPLKDLYKNIWMWCFKFRIKLDKPIPYTHPQGASVWVKDVL